MELREIVENPRRQETRLQSLLEARTATEHGTMLLLKSLDQSQGE